MVSSILSPLEQNYLVEMLKCERQETNFNPRRCPHLYKTMRTLEDYGAIKIVNSKRLEFQLTNFGRMLASALMKHPKVIKKLEKYAYDIGFMIWIGSK